jgi:hypothetical protein
MGAGGSAAASWGEAGGGGEPRHGGRRRNILAVMSESAAPPRIQGTGPKRMKSHGFFRRGKRRCPKSDTASRNDRGCFGTSDIHGGTRI